jgi:hypothetical protein
MTNEKLSSNKNSNLWRGLQGVILETLIGLAVCLSIIGLIYFDVVVLEQTCGEDSFIESAQASIYFLSAISFYNFGLKNRSISGAMYLIGGVLLCMFVRELDWISDKIFHGAWLYFALAVCFLSVFAALRVKNTIFQGFVWFAGLRASAYMIAGFLCVMVFSRLFGAKFIWYKLYDPARIRVVKNCVEEGLELYGASHIFISTILAMLVLRRNKKNLQDPTI